MDEKFQIQVGACQVFEIVYYDGRKLETKCKIVRRRSDTGEVLAIILLTGEFGYFTPGNF